MRTEELAKLVEQAIKEGLSMSKYNSSSSTLEEVEELMMEVCAKFKAAHEKGEEADVLSEAVRHLEEANELLTDKESVNEALVHDRKTLISQLQAIANRIISRAPFSHLPDGSLSVMVSNLDAIAKKI